MKFNSILPVFISLISVSISSCQRTHSGISQERGNQSQTTPPVLLDFIGNSCTLLTAADGTRILSDPYHDFNRPPGLEEFPGGINADAVTVSHSHPDHNNAEAIGGSPRLLQDAGVFQVGMVKVTGYEGREGSPSGPSENPHVVFVFEIGDVKIVHLGDSGPVTQPDVLAAIENADVLLANIDGYVIPPEQLFPFLQRAKVRTFIPTHYSLSTEARWQGAPTAEEFLQTLPPDMAVMKAGSRLEVRPNMLRQVATMIPLALVK
jgi:L-ascorbate metabolism protein UlaG (beta-lactamase superfamily)